MKTLIIIIAFFVSSPLFGQQRKNFNPQSYLERHFSFNPQKNYVNFPYVFKNESPYGRNALVIYDDYFKTYKISFNKENGMQTSCSIKDDDFISTGTFKYNGATYSLTNDKTGKW